MALNRQFVLGTFDGSYDPSVYGFSSFNEDDLILLCSEYDTETSVETAFIPIAQVVLDEVSVDYFMCGYGFPDGSFVSLVFMGSNFNIENDRFTLNFSYEPTILGSSTFSISSDGYKLLHAKMGYNTSVGTQTPSNGVFLESLNGADGSFADGTPVTVVGRDGAYKVLASRNYYNDAKEKQNMLFYLLERTDLAHKPTMLVADVHVQKVA